MTNTLKFDILLAVRKLLVLIGFILGNFSILLVSFLFLTVYTTKGSAATAPIPFEDISQLSNINNQYLPQQAIITQQATILYKDTRIILVENFFKKYRSPMVGTEKDIVAAADKYQIPYQFLPAIGACEGALGQRIPANSYNTWGWGIYGGKITYFSSWQEAIDTVTKGLKKEYFDKGLTTPEAIMAKYTPSSQTWATCVNRYLAEIR